ncbi:MAG: cell division protein FtsZ [Deltaproteobacteria bacterium]|nr:cell division protein FtsZ [Deltaproteobacteria bacterium]
MIEMDESYNRGARLKVIGVGGCGGNAVNTIISSGLGGVEFIAANTDVQDLKRSLAGVKIQLGTVITKGLGAGANPEVGRNAAIESKDALTEAFKGADMVFITAGMGGGTGTGASPVVAEAAKAAGALVVAIVTKPFTHEGARKMQQAEEGIKRLKEAADTIITIPNQRLLSVAEKKTSIKEAYRMSNEVLHQAVKGISDVITVSGEVNVDFADVRAVMSEMGQALMGSCVARGENRAADATKKAISSPLLEDISIAGARGVLINFTGPSDLGIHEVNEAMEIVFKEAHDGANIIHGIVYDDSMGDEIRVTVIATGFGKPEAERPHKDGAGLQPALILGDLDLPTVMRRGGQGGGIKNTELKRLSKLGGYNDEDEDLYDKPTFLRKQPD